MIQQLQHPGWIVEARRQGPPVRRTRWYVAIPDKEQAISMVRLLPWIGQADDVSAVRAMSQAELNMLYLKPGQMWESPY